MKKKVILPLIALLVTLALSLFTVACGGTDVTFKVTVEYDAAHGSVAVSDADGNAATTFKAGDRVVVTVAPDEGYVVDEFKVNGVDEELNNGVYACFASSNILVKVAFKADEGEEPPKPVKPITEEEFAEAYESVTTTFVADGEYTYKVEGGDTTVNPVTTIFGEHAVNIIEIEGDTGEVAFDDVYVDVDGKLAIPVHTINNTIEYLYSTPVEEFAEYGNPFKLLTASDFAPTDENGVFALTTADKKKGAATAITGYVETIVDFKLTVADDKISKVEIVTDRIKRSGGSEDDDSYYEFYYTATYSYTLSEWGEAEVDAAKTAPYATKPEHTALGDALAAMMLVKNYTIAVHEEEPFYEGDPGDGYGDLDYNVYVTETAIYYDCEKYEEGYVEQTSGGETLVYPFDYDPETETGKLYDAVKGFPTVASMRASFNGFAPEIFELDDDGAYVLRDEMYTLDNVHNILINFGEGLDQIRLYMSYSLDVGFKLNDDGSLYQVELFYYVGDAYVYRVLTYTDINETELPITIGDNFEKVSALDEYVGTYTDGKHTVVIDKTGITFDGAPFTVNDYSIQYDTFTGEWNDETWYITKPSKNQLAVYYLGETEYDDIMYVLTSTEIEPVEIPEEYVGVWSKDETTVAILYDKIEYNGKMLTVLSDEGENGLYATDGEYTYRFFAATIEDDDGEEVECLAAYLYLDGSYVSGMVLYRAVQTVTIMPEVLIGTFEGAYEETYYPYTTTEYEVVITLTTLQVKVDGVVQEITIKSVAHEIGSYGDYWEIIFDLDEVEYFIQEGRSSDEIGFGSWETSPRVNLYLTRVEESVTPPVTAVEVPEKYYGEYEGEDKGVTYYITITADGITVKIGDGEAKTATVTDYDSTWDALTLDIDGEEYGIGSTYGVENAIDFSNADFSIYVTLNLKVGGVTIPEKFCGKYKGSSGGTEYEMMIDIDGIMLSIGGNNVTVTVVEYDETEGYITVAIDGTEYMISDAAYDEPISKIMFAYTAYVFLNRAE